MAPGRAVHTRRGSILPAVVTPDNPGVNVLPGVAGNASRLRFLVQRPDPGIDVEAAVDGENWTVVMDESKNEDNARREGTERWFEPAAFERLSGRTAGVEVPSCCPRLSKLSEFSGASLFV